jgi:hypothetical protein
MRVVRTKVGTCLGLAAAIAASGAVAAEAQYLAPQAPPTYGSAPLALSRGTALRGIAGGPVALNSVNGNCLGYAQPMPSHVLNVAPGTAQVRIGAVSNVDTTLMVQTPDGRILCDDDGGEGLNPLLEFAASPGQYRVWVGSYSSSATGAYNLDATAIGGAPVGQVQGALYGAIEMTAGARPDPMIMTGTYGGQVQASNVDGNCRGWITQPPTHIVNARSGFQNLRFVVRADADTTLVIRYPDGRLVCDDDSGGAANPIVEGPTGPGQILVWVGSYSSGGSGPHMLGVTTIPGINYSNLGAPTPPPPVVIAPPPPVVVTPPPSGIPTVTARVDLLPRIPVTLIGPGMSPGTVAVWSPRGGAPIEVGLQRTRSGYVVYSVINGQMQTVAELPSDFVEQSVVTVTQRDAQRVLVRAELAPNGSDPGQQALMLVQMVNGLPAIAEQWIGSFAERAPRWAR